MDDRARLVVLVVPMVGITVAAWVGDALSPTLLAEEPLVLVALIPRNRFLVLTAPLVEFAPFFAVGMTRLLLTDPIFYLFGRWYGERGIEWAERRFGTPRSVRRLETWFRRAAYPVVVIAPNNIICVLAGAAGMPPLWFAVANFGGTALRLGLIWWLGDVFSEPLLDVVEFVSDYRWWFTGVTAAIVVLSIWRAKRAGRLPIEPIDEIEAELEP
jgi:membrane protein DedA with SNARE-associated domain